MFLRLRFPLPDPDGPGPVRIVQRIHPRKLVARRHLFALGAPIYFPSFTPEGWIAHRTWRVCGVGSEGSVIAVDLR